MGSCWAGPRQQEVSLKGRRSLAPRRPGRCWHECCACENRREILAHHEWRHVGHGGVGQQLQGKRFNVLNGGVNLTDSRCLAPGAPGCLRPTPSPLRMAPSRCTLGHGPARGGTRPGGRAAQPGLDQGQRQEVSRERVWHMQDNAVTSNSSPALPCSDLCW